MSVNYSNGKNISMEKRENDCTDRCASPLVQVAKPEWPAPSSIKAFYTTRAGDRGTDEYRGFNIALHVGDDARQVKHNRTQLPFADRIQWLDQQHTRVVLELDAVGSHTPVADASFTTSNNIACGVMTADCLPLLVCNRQGTFAAAIHAGWRGLAKGIIEHTVRQSGQSPEDLLVWLGPSISQTHFEVGEEVKAAFLDYSSAFVKSNEQGKFRACLHTIAVQKLQRLGVRQLFRHGSCTYAENQQFYSYRRATHQGHANTGRMLSYILVNGA